MILSYATIVVCISTKLYSIELDQSKFCVVFQASPWRPCIQRPDLLAEVKERVDDEDWRLICLQILQQKAPFFLNSSLRKSLWIGAACGRDKHLLALSFEIVVGRRPVPFLWPYTTLVKHEPVSSHGLVWSDEGIKWLPRNNASVLAIYGLLAQGKWQQVARVWQSCRTFNTN